MSSRTVKYLRFLPWLQTNKLPSQFHGCWIRTGDSGLEMQHSFLLTRRAVARVSAFVPGPQAPAPTGKGKEDQVTPTHTARCITGEEAWASVQFSHSVVSDSLLPHGLQHARPPCPSPAPGVYTNSCPFSQWGHPTISSSVSPFPCYLQSFPASGSFQMS